MDILSYITLSSHKIIIILAGILGLGFLIGIHELGHFLFCKLFRVSTPSFSIGFGPRLFSKQIGATKFSISAIPLGGYVEIAGVAEVGQGEQKEAGRQDQFSFAKKRYYQKVLIMSGGILFNLLFAYLSLCFLFALGLPKSNILYPLNAKPVIETVSQNSAAEKAGIQKGDKILAFGQTQIKSVDVLVQTIQKKPDQKIDILIERNGEKQTIPITVGKRDVQGKNIGSLGVTFEIAEQPGFPFFVAIKKGIYLTNRIIYGTIQAFKQLFVKRDVSNLSGPLSIISATAQGASQGFKVFLLLLAFISINLAILNLLPLPIFDGGQILYYTIEAIAGRSLPLKIRETIHVVSWLFILGLILYLTGKDILSMLPWFNK